MSIFVEYVLPGVGDGRRVTGKIRCPICHGTKRMTWVVADLLGKKTVRRTCTACGGKGWVPFIDRRKTENKPETREGEGWVKRRKWKKAHYFVEMGSSSFDA